MQGTVAPPPPPAPAPGATVTIVPPGLSKVSTWLMLAGSVMEGSDTAQALLNAGVSPATTALVATAGAFLIGLGVTLAQHGK
jgi:hypothetical protein